ncbi:MAG: Npt1/Npt2 family nucleotide transporter, partial [bacterium]
GARGEIGAKHAAGEAPAPSGMQILSRDPYLRSLALLVLLGTMAAAILDYILKARADAAYSNDEDLLRFFALFYMTTGIATFVVQAGLARAALERLGLARTVSAHALTVAATSVGAILNPALASAAFARGAESVLRSSLFRSGYELLFTPIRPSDKRATKAIIDVGAERLGDAAGGGVIKLTILLVPQLAASALLAMAGALALASLAVARRLHAGYIRSLERNLIDGAADLDSAVEYDSSTKTIVLKRPSARGGADLQRSTTLSVPAAPLEFAPGWESEHTIFVSRSELATPAPETDANAGVDTRAETIAERPARAEHAEALHPALARIAELRSGDAVRVRRALGARAPLSRADAPWVIALLTWDEMAPDAIATLRAALPKISGLLVDALLDPDEDFAVRRRIPRVLAASSAPAAVDGLLRGLDDKRFEVRYQCGRALARIRERSPETPIRAEDVFAAGLREVRVDKSVWESHRLLDRIEEKDDAPFVDEFVRERAGRSMEHLFTILSLALPSQPLQTAYRALAGDDPRLRGTALEYLESVLPAEIRESLWPFLDDARRREQPARSREAILEELLRSNQSMQINIAELRRQREER